MSIEKFEDYLPKIGNNVFIHKSAIIIGDVEIDKNSSVWPGAIIRGDLLSIKIGSNTNIQDNCILHTTHASKYNIDGYSLKIGNNVTIGHGAILHGCTVYNNVLIGMGSTILDGAIIPENVIIGANTLIASNKNLESGYLYYGNPVKQIRALTKEEIEFISYSSASYCKLKEKYLTQTN